MLKIPSLFERDWDGDKGRVLDKRAVELSPSAEPTRKWDGSAWRASSSTFLFVTAGPGCITSQRITPASGRSSRDAALRGLSGGMMVSQ